MHSTNKDPLFILAFKTAQHGLQNTILEFQGDNDQFLERN